MLHVSELHDLAALSSRHLIWKLLHFQTAQATFLQSIHWWRHLLERGDLTCRVLCAELDGETIGLLPFIGELHESATRTWRTTLNSLAWPVMPLGSNPTATWAAVCRQLAHQTQSGDVVELRWIEREGLDQGRAHTALRQVGLEPSVEQASTARIDMGESWFTYWATRDRLWRAALEETERHVVRNSSIEYVHYRPDGRMAGDADEHWDWLTQCEQMPAASMLGNPRIAELLHESAVSAGALDWHLLWIDEQLAAFAYGVHDRQRVELLWMAQTSSAAQNGLLLRLLRAIHERGSRRVTLPIGSWPQFRGWSTRRATYESYRHERAASHWLPKLHWPKWLGSLASSTPRGS